MKFISDESESLSFILRLRIDKGIIEYIEDQDEYHLISVKELADRTVKEKIDVINENILTRGDKEQIEFARRCIKMVKEADDEVESNDYEKIAYFFKPVLW